MSQEAIDLVHSFYEDGEYSRQFPGKKDYVSIQKGVRKQKWLVLCNLHELFVTFKERNPDLKIGFSKFYALCPKWCVIAGSSGTHSVCVCSTPQNTTLLVDALNWKLHTKILSVKQNVIHQIVNVWCIVVLTVRKQMHYVNSWKRSSVTLIPIFNFTTHMVNYRQSFPGNCHINLWRIWIHFDISIKYHNKTFFFSQMSR